MGLSVMSQNQGTVSKSCNFYNINQTKHFYIKLKYGTICNEPKTMHRIKIMLQLILHANYISV